MGIAKTNALRSLEAAGIPHLVREYDTSDGKVDGLTVAERIGQDPGCVFKTLVTIGKTMGHLVFVVPVEYELDLKKAALAAGDKYVEMIKAKDLEPLTGYIHGGCSPVGMKKAFPTFIDETAQLFETINVSAGKVGIQMELSPEDLATVTSAVFADIV